MDSSLRILCLSQDKPWLAQLPATLRGAGFEAEIRVAAQLGDFLDALSQGPFKLMLADFTTPELILGDVLKRLQNLKPALPVLLVVDRADPLDLAAAFKAGALDLVLKARPDLLRAAVRAALERREPAPAEPAADPGRATLMLMKSIQEATTDGLLVINKKRQIVTYNQRFLQMWNIPAALMEGDQRPALMAYVRNQLLDPEAFARKAEAMLDDLEMEAFDELEFNDNRVFERFSTPYRLDGAPQGRVYSFRDVSARRRAEAALTYEREIIADSKIIVCRWQVRPTRRVEYISPNISLWGYAPDDFYSGRMTPIDLMHPDDRPRVDHEARTNFIKGVDNFTQEYRIRTADGAVRWIQDQTLFRRTPQGDIRHFDFSLQDITDRKQLELSLASERQIISESGIVIFRVRKFPSRKVEYVSANVSQWGYTPEDFYAGRMGNLDHVLPEDRHAAYTIYQAAVSGCRENVDLEYRIICKDGAERWIYDHTRIIFDAEGRVTSCDYSLLDITDRKRAEEAVRRTESRFRAIVQKSHDLITLYDEGGLITYISPPARDILDFDPDWMTGRHFNEFVHPEDQAGALQTFTSLLEAPGATLTQTNRCRRADGSWIHVEAQFTNLLHDPAVRAIVSHTRDISDRVSAQHALTASEAHYRSLQQNSTDIITLLDAEGRILYESPSIRRILGYAPNFLIGVLCFDLIHPDDAAQVQERFGRLLAEPGSPVEVTFRFRHQDGQWIYLEAVGANLLADPAVGAIVVNSRDVTDRHNAMESLALTLQRLRLHIENTPLAVIECNHERQVVAWNHGAEAMFGYAAREALGRNIDFMMTDTSRAHMRELFKSMIRTGQTVDNPVIENRRADGKTLTCHWYNTLLAGPQSDVFGVASLIQDISELKRTQRELEEFIFTTAHDLKAPLLSIRGYAAILQQKTAGLPDCLNAAQRVVANSERLDSLIAGLLEYAQLGYRERREEWMQLSDTARSLMASLIPPDDTVETEIIGDVTDPWEILIDRRDLERLMANLISNARAYRHATRPLKLSAGLARGTGANTGTLGLFLRDNGRGISQDQHQYIFRLFTRLQSRDGGIDASGGHGIGLAIVKRLTEEYGGRVGVESLLDGTCFYLWLPRSRFRRPRLTM